MLKQILRVISLWIERKIQTYDFDRRRKEEAERNARMEAASRRGDEMANAIGGNDLGTVERLMRERRMRDDPRFGPSS